jgi:hypothetical protein
LFIFDGTETGSAAYVLGKRNRLIVDKSLNTRNALILVRDDQRMRSVAHSPR